MRIPENSKLNNKAKSIIDKVAKLREDYIHNIPGFGAVILKDKRQYFETRIEAINADIEKVKEELNQKLKVEFEKSKQEIIKILLPIVKKIPPHDLVLLINGKPSVEMLTEYLNDELDNTLPSADEFVGKMNIRYVYKDVTYEMLNKNEFQKALENHKKLGYYFKSNKLFTENEAIKAKEIDDSTTLF